jgi:hypothetical protein
MSFDTGIDFYPPVGSLLPGTIVNYRPKEGESGHPAVVLAQWPDDSVQLHVFFAASTSYIRSAQPNEFEVMLSPTQFVDLVQQADLFEKRLSDLEDATEALMPLFLKLRKVLTQDDGPRIEILSSTISEIPESELQVLADQALVEGLVDSTPDSPEDTVAEITVETISESADDEPPSPWSKKHKGRR